MTTATMTEHILPHDLVTKIAHSLREEEEDVYVLTLYSINSADMDYFSDADKERVKSIFRILMEDTRRHADLLRFIVENGDL